MPKQFLEAKVKSVSKEEGTFEVVASNKKPDRYGDTIDPKGWYLKNYKKNPVILWSHSQGGFGSVAIPPVAKSEKTWVEGEKELRLRGRWAETRFAQELKQLVQGGFLNATSVGFLPLVPDEKGAIDIEGKMYRRITATELKCYTEKGSVEINGKMYGKGTNFTHQELLEVSWVNVPALPSALVTAREMKLDLVTKELEAVKTDPLPAESKAKKETYECECLDCKHKMTTEKHCADIKCSKCGGKMRRLERPGPGKELPAQKDGLTTKEFKDFNSRLSAVEKAISVPKDTKDPEKGACPQVDEKGRTQNVNKKSKKSEMERLLIIFDKFCEVLLRELRQLK